MAAILNFRIFRKIAKHKNAYISKTVLDRAISTKFLTHRVSLQSSHANFQKKFCLAKNGGHFEFSDFCAKIAKHKNANFQTKNFSQKMAAILNFRIFRKITKHKNAYISKTVLDRAISTKFLTHRVSLQSSHANFQKKFCLAKNGGHFEFSNFCAKIAKHKNANISKTVLHRAISTKFFIFRVSLQSSYPKCELSLKVLQIANFSQITHSPTFGRAFTW